MKRVPIEKFVQSPEKYVRDAANGEFCEVTTADGSCAVICDKTEWTMLLQALKICMENPQWIKNNT